MMPPPTVQHRTLGVLDQAGNLLQGEIAGAFVGLITAECRLADKLRFGPLLLNVLRDVNDHGSRPTASSNVERLVDDPRDAVDICDQVTVLHDGERQTKEVRFLKRSFSNHVLRNLSRDCHQRNRIKAGIRNPGNEIRGPWPARGHAHAHAAR